MEYPLQRQAEELQKHGRYGDTMLLHVNPAEVAGIAALTPGGLTRNPQTGQPEAFLPFLLPLLASWGGGAAAGALGAGAVGSAIASGAASGLATTAMTGDLKRGLISGVMGAGLGAGLGAAGQNAAEAAASGAGEGALGGSLTDMSAALGGAPVDAASDAALQGALAQNMVRAGDIGVAGTDLGVVGSAGAAPAALPTTADTSFMDAWGARLKAPFQKGSGVTGELLKPRTMIPMAMGLGQMSSMDQQDALNQWKDKKGKESAAKKAAAYTALQGGYRAAQPGAMTGWNPYRNRMSPNTPPPWVPGMSEGGSARRQDYNYLDNPYAAGNMDDYWRTQGYSLGYNPTIGYNPFFGGPRGQGNPGYGGIDPVTIQQNLRGRTRVDAPSGYMAGFNPEFDYFQNIDEGDQPYVPPHVSPQERMGMYANSPINRFLTTGGGSFKSTVPGIPGAANITPIEKVPLSKDKKPPISKADGGTVGLQLGDGRSGQVMAGGIADVPTEFSQPQQPSEQDVQMLAMALMGGVENPDAIINGFIQQYGVETFRALREMILKASSPDAQTEGKIEGEGGGMDDQVPGTIGKDQPVAVSPGEYIVPADVVSGLGDGSSDAGAAELDNLSSRVRQIRQGGSTSQPPSFNAREVMPV